MIATPLIFLLALIVNPYTCPANTVPLAHCDMSIVNDGGSFVECFEYGADNISISRVAWEGGEVVETDWAVNRRGIMVRSVLANGRVVSILDNYAVFGQVTLTAHDPTYDLTWCGVEGKSVFIPQWKR